MKEKKGISYLKRRATLNLAFWYRLATASRRGLPNFIMIGGQKCGSTSLYDYVKKHPNIIPAYKKAAHFFDIHYTNGENWYRAHFPLRSQYAAPSLPSHNNGKIGFLAGEASPYYIFHPMAARRAAEHVPEAKLIVLLRNPVSRTYSHYNHMVRIGRENLSFEEAIEKEAERLDGAVEEIIADPEYPLYNHRSFSYLARSMYAGQLEEWFKYFSREQFLIMPSEHFFKDPDSVCGRVYQYLGLPAWSLKTYKNSNPGGYAPINAGTRAKLAGYFRPHNERLYELLGQDFGWDRPH